MKKLLLAAIMLPILGAGCSNSTPEKTAVPPMETAPQTPSSTNEDPAAGGNTRIRMGANGLIVEDQKPGDTVTISFVRLEKPGYVVILTKNADGSWGPILASSELLAAGDHNDVVISDKNLITDKTTYNVLLLHDDGDKKLDRAKDQVAADRIDDMLFPIDMTFQGSISAGDEDAPSRY